jgi:hypothetical protein
MANVNPILPILIFDAKIFILKFYNVLIYSFYICLKYTHIIHIFSLKLYYMLLMLNIVDIYFLSFLLIALPIHF